MSVVVLVCLVVSPKFSVEFLMLSVMCLLFSELFLLFSVMFFLSVVLLVFSSLFSLRLCNGF